MCVVCVCGGGGGWGGGEGVGHGGGVEGEGMLISLYVTAFKLLKLHHVRTVIMTFAV